MLKCIFQIEEEIRMNPTSNGLTIKSICALKKIIKKNYEFPFIVVNIDLNIPF